MYEFLTEQKYETRSFQGHDIRIKLLTSGEFSEFQRRRESDPVDAIRFLLGTSLPGLDPASIPIRLTPGLTELVLQVNKADSSTEATEVKN